MHTDKNRRITGVLVCLGLLFLSLGTSGVEATSSSETVVIEDYTGQFVEVPCPVEKVICLSSYASWVLCALGGGDKIIGRDSNSDFPPCLEDIPVVGQSSYNPSVELILEYNPELVIADTMLSDDLRYQIESGGVPVIVTRSGDPDRTITNVKNFGLILDENERAKEIITFIEHYHSITEERTASLEQEDMPIVLGERANPWNVASPGTGFGDKIEAVGGINIAAGETSGKYIVVSSEWVAEKDPDIIVFQVSGMSSPTEEELEEVRNEILSRPGLGDVNAVKDDQVYIVTPEIMGGAPSLIGSLYFAKWFHPDLFEDIDPEAVHRELFQKFLDLELDGVYVYP